MIPRADVIRKLLIDLGLGASTNTSTSVWPIYVMQMPTTPDNAIAVFDTAGLLQGRIMETGEQIEKPGIQIIVRSLNSLTAYQKVRAIALALDATYQRVINWSSANYRLDNFSRQGDVLPMGLDEADRPRYNFALNGIVTLKDL